jgi:hypothetical protein
MSRKRYAAWLLVLVALAGPAHADALLPYVVVPYAQVFLFPVIVIIEFVVLLLILKGRWWKVLLQSLLVNLASTLVGVGLSYATLMVVGDQIYAAWSKVSFERERVVGIETSIGIAVLLFFLSWVIESFLLVRLRRVDPRRKIWVASAIANVVSYIGLVSLSAFSP